MSVHIQYRCKFLNIFDLVLVESVHIEPKDLRGQLYAYTFSLKIYQFCHQAVHKFICLKRCQRKARLLMHAYISNILGFQDHRFESTLGNQQDCLKMKVIRRVGGVSLRELSGSIPGSMHARAHIHTQTAQDIAQCRDSGFNPQYLQKERLKKRKKERKRVRQIGIHQHVDVISFENEEPS